MLFRSPGPTEGLLLGVIFDVMNLMEVGEAAPAGLSSQPARRFGGVLARERARCDQAPHDT